MIKTLCEFYPCKPGIFKHTYEEENKSEADYTKRFIVFTDKDLEDIKAGKLVTVKDCKFSDNDKPYSIHIVSEAWMKEYDNEENTLP